MSLNPENIGNNAEGFTETIRQQNIANFQASFLSESELQSDPETMARKQALETEAVRLETTARRMDMALAMPGNPLLKEQMIQQYWGRLDRAGNIPKTVQPESYIRYGNVNIARWKAIYTPDRLEQLQSIATSADGVDDTVIDAIAHNTDGRGYGLELPDVSGDSETFLEDVQSNRYIIADRNIGILRPNIQQINQDLAKLRALPLNKEAQPFIAFLEELQKVDPELHYKHVYVPKMKEKLENSTLSNAAGATRMLFGLALAGIGAISVLSSLIKGEDVSPVALMYLGAAGLVISPKTLTNGPTEHLAQSLSFTVPRAGERDKWGELMGVDSFHGEVGLQIFDMLLDPYVQTYNSQVAGEKIQPERYFQLLEEEGFADEQIQPLKQLWTEKPELFAYLITNMPRVRSPQAQELLLSYVNDGMTAEKARRSVPTPIPEEAITQTT